MCCSLFLHHLEEHDAVALLVTMAEKARRTVLVQDLRRTAAGYALAFAVLRLISRSDVAHTDGSRSMEGAFSLRESRGRGGLARLTRRDAHPVRMSSDG
ncbi:MAG: hypothetical protein VX815_06360 [Gemmatimonadota bacterium]|nr:hypothetical protein [Gemmatimonadota bacterium]